MTKKSRFAALNEEEMDTVEGVRRIMTCVGGVVSAVIDCCITNSVNNDAKLTTRFVELGDEVLLFMHEPFAENKGD